MFKIDNSDDKDSNSVDDIEKLINENSSEHQQLLDSFKKSMDSFATERSMDTCLQALNVSIQLASVRSTLTELYKSYCRLLEREVTRLRKITQENTQ
jgi:hypothetical protein